MDTCCFPVTIRIGSAISGISSAFGGGDDGPSVGYQLMKQNQWNKIAAREMPLAQKEGWEKAGIHPIYGMGGSSSQFSAPMSVGDSTAPNMGKSLAEAGAGISRAAEAMSNERERLQNRMLNTQIKGQELENAKKASDLVVATTSQTPGLPGSYTFQRNQNVPMRYMPMVNPDGSITSVTNPEAGDNEFLMAYDFMTKTMPDELKNSFKRSKRKWSKRIKKLMMPYR